MQRKADRRRQSGAQQRRLLQSSSVRGRSESLEFAASGDEEPVQAGAQEQQSDRQPEGQTKRMVSYLGELAIRSTPESMGLGVSLVDNSVNFHVLNSIVHRCAFATGELARSFLIAAAHRK